MTLADLKPGQRAVIDAVDTGDPAVLRLMVMGLVEGTELELVNVSLGGDPLEFHIADAAVSLRRTQAGRFTVSPRT